jgi:hypothetical protein
LCNAACREQSECADCEFGVPQTWHGALLSNCVLIP